MDNGVYGCGRNSYGNSFLPDLQGGVADSITEVPVGKGGTVGTAVADALAKIPGSSQYEKFWIVVGVALVAGAIVGGIVCLMQKPAIIVITAGLVGLLITQGVFCRFGVCFFAVITLTNFIFEVFYVSATLR